MGSADFFSRWKQLAKYDWALPHSLSFSRIMHSIKIAHTSNNIIVVIVPIFIIALFPVYSQEAQKIFAAKHSMEKEFAASKVNY